MLKLPSTPHETASSAQETLRYQIRVRGILDPKWADWFGDFVIKFIGGDSLLTGQVPDQAALHGVIGRIRDLGLTLIFIKQITPKNKKK